MNPRCMPGMTKRLRRAAFRNRRGVNRMSRSSVATLAPVSDWRESWLSGRRARAVIHSTVHAADA